MTWAHTFAHREERMSIKDELTKKGMQMMSDHRFTKLLQNPQFMKAMLTLMQVPGKVNAFTNEQSERFASTLKLATQQEVKELRKTVKKLERDVERLREKLDRISAT